PDPDRLAGKAGGILSLPEKFLLLARYRFFPAARNGVVFDSSDLEEAAVFNLWLDLVSGHAVASHWTGSGRQSGPRRSLHVYSVDRCFRACGLGCARFFWPVPTASCTHRRDRRTYSWLLHLAYAATDSVLG